MVAALPLPMPRNRRRNVCGQRRPRLATSTQQTTLPAAVMNPVTWRPFEGMRLLLARMATKPLLSTVLHANVRPQISHFSGGVAHELRHSPPIGTRLALVNSWSQILQPEGKSTLVPASLASANHLPAPLRHPRAVAQRRAFSHHAKRNPSLLVLIMKENNERENVR